MTPAERRLHQVVWVALVTATCIYGVIDWIVVGRLVPLNGFEQEIRSPVVLALYGVAVAAFFAALTLRHTRRREIFIARMALFESVAVLGLVAAFLTNDWRLFLPTWLVAMVGFVQTFPPGAEYTPGP